MNNGSFLLADTVINVDKDGRLFRHRPPDSSNHTSAVFAYLRNKLAFLRNIWNKERHILRKRTG